MLSFLCNDQRDWQEPGHFKFLDALQEDAGNNFSYLIPMNIVNGGRGGDNPPPPSTSPSCMLSFLCNDQRDWEEPGHLKFLNAFQEDAGKNFSYLVPMNIVNGGGGGNNLPRGKVSPSPPSCMLSFLCYDKGLRRAWSFEVFECPSRGCRKQFLQSRPYEYSQYRGGGGGQSTLG